jgi:hypothetical protein
MSLLAEEIVEEWLNRNGYFTIRGIKLGVHEIDLLALALHGSKIEARHIEVQASVNPIGYLCQLSKGDQKKTGRKSGSMKKRTPAEMAKSVAEWVRKKYHLPAKKRLRNALFPGEWQIELVIHRVRFPEEIELLKEHGIKIHMLRAIADSLSESSTLIKSAAGTDLLDLIKLGGEA